MNPILSTILGVLAPAIPTAIEKVYDDISKLVYSDDTPKRKIRDSHKFTEEEIDTIKKRFEIDKKLGGRTQQDTANYLNDVLGRDKSVSAYRAARNK